MWKRILLILISVTCTLVISELLVRKFRPQPVFSQVTAFSFSCYASDEFIPFTLKKNSVCRMIDPSGDYETFATINSLGYRGREFSTGKSPGKKRILMLGDSFTFGIGASDGDTFSSKLEKMLENQGKNAEVINAGYADGFSPDSYYLFFKRTGIKLKPDVVIMNFFVWNDITDLSETIWEKTDSNGLPEKIVSCCRTVDGGSLINKSRPLRYSIPILRESHLFQLLMNFLSTRFDYFKDPINRIPKRDFYKRCITSASCMDNFSEEEKRTYETILATKKLADENNIRFLLVLIPVDFQLYPDAWAKYGSMQLLPKNSKDFIQKRIKEKLAPDNMPILDLYPIFDANRNRGNPYFPNDAHFNSLGNQMTAETIDNYLQENNILKT